MAGNAFIAWHGSPADFSAFDLAKVGSNMGFLPVPFGIFLAQSKSVAEFARDCSCRARGDGSRGHLYEVRVRAAADQLLDWDLPLRQQPATIQTKVALLFRLYGLKPSDRATGSDLWDELVVALADARGDILKCWPRAASALHAVGIRGARKMEPSPASHLAKFFRAFIVFDARTLEIVSKDGEPLSVPCDVAA